MSKHIQVTTPHDSKTYIVDSSDIRDSSNHGFASAVYTAASDKFLGYTMKQNLMEVQDV